VQENGFAADRLGQRDEGAGFVKVVRGLVVVAFPCQGVATPAVEGRAAAHLEGDALGYTGTELQEAINGNAAALARFETIRAHGALRMGLIKDIAKAASRQHTPKIAFVAPPKEYVSSSGKRIGTGDIDVLVRALSMGKLHHAMMGNASVAIATAAAVPG